MLWVGALCLLNVVSLTEQFVNCVECQVSIQISPLFVRENGEINCLALIEEQGEVCSGELFWALNEFGMLREDPVLGVVAESTTETQ